uniref:Uncharacterized protein n=1 Tax=Glossina brevipalpis TaxID=37001 RepID=A0A1A9WD67_9MUSC
MHRNSTIAHHHHHHHRHRHHNNHIYNHNSIYYYVFEYHAAYSILRLMIIMMITIIKSLFVLLLCVTHMKTFFARPRQRGLQRGEDWTIQGGLNKALAMEAKIIFHHKASLESKLTTLIRGR